MLRNADQLLINFPLTSRQLPVNYTKQTKTSANDQSSMMDSTSIIFRIAQGDFCPPNIDHGGISESQLEALVQKTRDATLVLEAELEKRHNATFAAPSNLIKEYENKLHNSIQNLKIHGRLDARSAKSVELAISVLPTEQTVRSSRIYRDFLNSVIRHCGHGLALLCAASLGKQNIVAMNAEARTSLISHIKSKKASLYSPDLETLAKQHNLPVGTGTLYISYIWPKAD